MRKRFPILLVALACVCTFAGAQETTWINPYSSLTYFMPTSMIGAVSFGQSYDEFDVIVRSPAELSNYSGYGVYTGYGNYEHWLNLMGVMGAPAGSNLPTTPLNPFSTNAMADGVEIGNYLVGYTFPLMEWRAGAVAGYSHFKTPLLDIADAYSPLTGMNESVFTFEETGTEDGDNDGSAEYTWTESADYTDFVTNTLARAGVGIDLGFIGLALFANSDTVNRRLGGVYDYAWTIGADTPVPAADTITTQTIIYGRDADGAVRGYPTTGSIWTLGAVGELPFSLGELSAPITAALLVGSNGAPGSPYTLPTTTTTSTVNPTGGFDVTDTETLTIVSGSNTVAFNGGLAAAATQNLAMPGTIGTLGRDLANDRHSDFYTELRGNLEPVIVLNDTIRALTRAEVGYRLSLENDTDAGVWSAAIDSPAAVGESYDYTWSQTIVSPTSNTQHTIDAELGGVLEFGRQTGIITLSTGFFYAPTLDMGVTRHDNQVTTTTIFYNDPSIDNQVTDVADTIGPGDFEGRSVTVSTTTYAGNSSARSVAQNFYLPVSAELTMVPGKLSLIGGYILNHQIASYRETDANATTTSVTTVYETNGSVVDDNSTNSIDSTSTTGGSTTHGSSAWDGQANFMLRWILNPNITVDFFGQMIMAALNFDIFGGAAATGFNPSTFVSSLGFSVSFHF